MARVCSVCAKGPATGHNVSHANNRTNRRWYPNLQTVRTLLGAHDDCVRGGGAQVTFGEGQLRGCHVLLQGCACRGCSES